MSAISLVTPGPAYLASYVAALRTGWSPDNTRDVHEEQLISIRRNTDAFLKDLIAMEGPIRHADGTITARLPNKMFWIWDGEFCGMIGLRWQAGNDALPPYVSGHIGYSVVPWKRRLGYASQALAMVLNEARGIGLRRVFVSADTGNLASRGVIEKNCGVALGPGSPPATGKIEPGAIGYWIEL
jgi:predicted acetyltransferase